MTPATRVGAWKQVPPGIPHRGRTRAGQFTDFCAACGIRRRGWCAGLFEIDVGQQDEQVGHADVAVAVEVGRTGGGTRTPKAQQLQEISHVHHAVAVDITELADQQLQGASVVVDEPDQRLRKAGEQLSLASTGSAIVGRSVMPDPPATICTSLGRLLARKSESSGAPA